MLADPSVVPSPSIAAAVQAHEPLAFLLRDDHEHRGHGEEPADEQIAVKAGGPEHRPHAEQARDAVETRCAHHFFWPPKNDPRNVSSDCAPAIISAAIPIAAG